MESLLGDFSPKIMHTGYNPIPSIPSTCKAFGIAEAEGIESFESYKSDPEMAGILMDKPRSTGLVDRDRAEIIDLSGYQEVKFSDFEVGEDSDGDKQYKINDTLYSGSTVDRMLKFSMKNKKDYDKLIILQEETKPIFIEIPDTDKRLGILIAPMQPEEEHDPYDDDSEEDLEDF